MMDRFRYAFTFPAAGASDFPVLVERELRPGKYHLRMKVQDANSSHAALREIDFEVPVPVLPTLPAADAKAEEAVNRVAQAQEPALALQGPEGEGVTGVQRVTALVGPKVAKVQFLLDGRPIMTKNRPPFEVDLDLGPLPRLASIVAVALDANDQEIDRRRIDVNVGRERFLVRLQPVGASDRQGGKVHASVTVNVPPDRKLSRVELYWNELKVATLFAPPFEAWLPVKEDGSIGYLRALAVLEDEGQAEDVQFVNAPQYLTGVQVATVELPVIAIDPDGKPVEGLKEADFDVSEDGVKQTVSFFARQQDLPIRLGLVIDTSGSMEKTLPEVQRVVVGFLRNLLRPRDRAYVEAFNDRTALLEGFSADFGALERAMIALRADGETALYDAAVYGLFQFSGVRGRKAMIILSDGDDNASRMDFEKALDYAKRSGVTIYTVGIDLPITKVGIRSHLTRLARTTGGEAFFLARGRCPRAGLRAHQPGAAQPVPARVHLDLRGAAGHLPQGGRQGEGTQGRGAHHLGVLPRRLSPGGALKDLAQGGGPIGVEHRALAAGQPCHRSLARQHAAASPCGVQEVEGVGHRDQPRCGVRPARAGEAWVPGAVEVEVVLADDDQGQQGQLLAGEQGLEAGLRMVEEQLDLVAGQLELAGKQLGRAEIACRHRAAAPRGRGRGIGPRRLGQPGQAHGHDGHVVGVHCLPALFTFPRRQVGERVGAAGECLQEGAGDPVELSDCQRPARRDAGEALMDHGDPVPDGRKPTSLPGLPGSRRARPARARRPRPSRPVCWGATSRRSRRRRPAPPGTTAAQPGPRLAGMSGARPRGGGGA